MSTTNQSDLPDNRSRLERSSVPTVLQDFAASVWRVGLNPTEQGMLRVGAATQGPNRPLPELRPDIRQQATPLLADLGAPSFQVREAAMRQLMALGPSAIPYLREFLNSNPSVEALRRTEQIMGRLLGQTEGVERDRYGRVVQIHRSDAPCLITYVNNNTNDIATADVVIPAVQGRQDSEPMHVFFRRNPTGGYQQFIVGADGRRTQADDIENLSLDAQANLTLVEIGGSSLTILRNGELRTAVR